MAARSALKVSDVAPVDLGSAADRARVSAVATRAVGRVAEFWQLGAADISALLGGLSERTWYRLRKGEAGDALSQDVLTRISLVVGIYKGLHLVFSNPLADEWVRRPNSHPVFAGRTPLSAMIAAGIPKMIETRAYVDALRGGL